MRRRVALTACSDARKEEDREQIKQLKTLLEGFDIKVEESRYLYNDDAAGREKAEELSGFFRNKDMTAIFDVSGGNVANELLPYIDYDAIKTSRAVFFGYSDLTTIINAIYAKTGKASVLYQVRHLVGNEERQREFLELIEHISCGAFDGDFEKVSQTANINLNNIDLNQIDFNKIDYRFLQGKELNGSVVGGNLRCFLKLAGTEYIPDVTDKVLLMEALGGDLYSVRTMLAQLSQLGVFDKIRGIVVGTFTSLIREGEYDRFLKLLLDQIPKDMPVVVTGDIGHGRDAKGIIIGEEINFYGII